MSVEVRSSTPTLIGKVCKHHPELKGLRYASNRTCPGCAADRNKDPARMAYKRKYQREWREDPAIRALENEKREARRGPRKVYTAAEWAGAMTRIRNLEAKLAAARARIAQLEAR